MNIGKHLSYLYEPVHGHCTAVCDGMVIQVTAELVPDENTSSSMSARSAPARLQALLDLSVSTPVAHMLIVKVTPGYAATGS